MKTFLWTTLFRIVAAIAWLLCLGFGNLWTQVLDNTWMIKFLPENMQTRACEPVVASALEDIDRCAAAEANNCVVNVEAEEENLPTLDADLQTSLNDIMDNQVVIYNQMNDSFAVLQQMIVDLTARYSAAWAWGEEVVDERELQRLQLQAQIEALQAEMANL